VGDPLGGKSPVARIALEKGIGTTESALPRLSRGRRVVLQPSRKLALYMKTHGLVKFHVPPPATGSSSASS
jgi:hypothetical protein